MVASCKLEQVSSNTISIVIGASCLKTDASRSALARQLNEVVTVSEAIDARERRKPLTRSARSESLYGLSQKRRTAEHLDRYYGQK